MAHDVDILAGRDLELDTAVAFGLIALDLIEQRVHVALDSQADTREDLGSRTTQERSERFLLGASPGVPAGHFETRAGETIAFDEAIKTHQLIDVRPVAADHGRAEKVAKDVPARFSGFGAVKRVGRTGAFTPADHALRIDSNQDMVKVLLAARARLEWSNQGEAAQSSSRFDRFASCPE